MFIAIRFHRMMWSCPLVIRNSSSEVPELELNADFEVMTAIIPRSTLTGIDYTSPPKIKYICSGRYLQDKNKTSEYISKWMILIIILDF